MLNVKNTLTKLLTNQLIVERFSKEVIFAASAQSSTDIAISIPNGATIKSVSIATAPNANWITCGIVSWTSTYVRVAYHNFYTNSITSSIEVSVLYTI